MQSRLLGEGEVTIRLGLRGIFKKIYVYEYKYKINKDNRICINLYTVLICEKQIDTKSVGFCEINKKMSK